MNPSHKPQAYTTVSPYLIVDGASHTIEFLVRVFDAVELRRSPTRTASSCTPKSVLTIRS